LAALALGIAIVLENVDHWRLPEPRHVEALVGLPLVGSAVAQVGQGDVVVAAIAIGEGEPGPQRHGRTDDAMAAIEALLDGEHVHGAALALGIAVATPGELGHDPLWIHAAGKHVT